MMAAGIDGHTQLIGLIGWPVEHSLSPLMHNAAFEDLGMNWRYLPLPVPPGQVETAVRGLAALGFRGANVTLPHKRAVISVLDSIDPHAAALGAVNTLVVGRRAGKGAVVGGYNTDDQGFVGALRRGGFSPGNGDKAIVVGAGGAARAIVHGLLQSGSGEVLVLNRSLERARSLVSDLGQTPGEAARLHALPLSAETLVASVQAAELLVNATPTGMWPDVEDSIWPAGTPIPAHLTVFDLVYNPLETRLLQQARESGARALDGLEMLVRQGALSFELWTGRPAPIDVMRAACVRALGG